MISVLSFELNYVRKMDTFYNLQLLRFVSKCKWLITESKIYIRDTFLPTLNTVGDPIFVDTYNFARSRGHNSKGIYILKGCLIRVRKHHR